MRDSEVDLRELVSHPSVVEVLDALSDGPKTFRDMCPRVAPTPRRLASALRVVAAYGLVARTDNGSWDAKASDDTIYRPTDLGREVIEMLSEFSVWTTLVDPPTAVIPGTKEPRTSARDRHG